jgi:hypothetical protein
MRSTDGVNWSGVSLPSFVGDPIPWEGHGVAWNGYRWIAVGRGTTKLLTSTDGINWEKINQNVFVDGQAYGISWNGTVWVAVGAAANTIITSPDGFFWTSPMSPTNPVEFSLLGYGVASNNVWKVTPSSSDDALTTLLKNYALLTGPI